MPSASKRWHAVDSNQRCPRTYLRGRPAEAHDADGSGPVVLLRDVAVSAADCLCRSRGVPAGTLAAAIALMVWLYWTAFAILLGGEINADLLHEEGRRLALKEAAEQTDTASSLKNAA